MSTLATTNSQTDASLPLDDRLDPAQYLRLGRYVFKPAETADEFAQVHRLNYQTFVRELPQHADPGDGQLIDKYHDRNIYYVALDRGRVIGMVSCHGQPPFSISEKMPEPNGVYRDGPKPLEVRLLAIEPQHRHRYVLTGLLLAIYRYAEQHRYSHMLICGVAERQRLYERFGLRPLGPSVRSGEVPFVPMSAKLERIRKRISRLHDHITRRALSAAEVPLPKQPPRLDAVSMMPGPAHLSERVAEAFARPQISHRSLRFTEMFGLVRKQLKHVTGKDAALFVGSGTLANEVVAATLAADRTLRRGLVLANGEFGRRLNHQARRVGLKFESLKWRWGQPWDLAAITETLDRHDDINWIWGVHMESSTGLVNNVEGLTQLAGPRCIRVCLDSVSGLGAVPLDLTDVHLASGVSNKSLGSVAGIAIVFADPQHLQHAVDQDRVPSYLDLVEALKTQGPRFTFPSPQIQALATALGAYADRGGKTFDRYATLGRFVRQQLSELGLPPLVDGPDAAPVVTTFSPPAGCDAHAFIQRCLDWGFQIGGESIYLRQRNWLQLATMGAVTLDDCHRLFDRLDNWLRRSRTSAETGDPMPAA